jgi:hypothetical protein
MQCPANIPLSDSLTPPPPSPADECRQNYPWITPANKKATGKHQSSAEMHPLYKCVSVSLYLSSSRAFGMCVCLLFASPILARLHRTASYSSPAIYSRFVRVIG